VDSRAHGAHCRVCAPAHIANKAYAQRGALRFDFLGFGISDRKRARTDDRSALRTLPIARDLHERCAQAVDRSMCAQVDRVDTHAAGRSRSRRLSP
jgi:hypothetical protein